jgi:hypothetical protein
MRAGGMDIASGDAPVEAVIRPAPVGRPDSQAIGVAARARRTGPAVYLVATDDSRGPAYAATRAAALQVAQATGGRVVPYDGRQGLGQALPGLLAVMRLW